MPRKITTNTELLVDLMEHSPVGALAQAFIVNAISKYANRIAAVPDEDLKALFEREGMGDFVSPQAWKCAAVDIQKRLDAFYGSRTEITS